MGTTRMAADPDQGIVDPSCRLHTVDNLYIASSSVFPSVGYSNPTLTIIALAVRLAEHLRLGLVG
jgi:choline dehydrogenase-like flavoprotein